MKNTLDYGKSATLQIAAFCLQVKEDFSINKMTNSKYCIIKKDVNVSKLVFFIIQVSIKQVQKLE